MVRALADPATIGEAYELGGPRYWTYREITREVAGALGKRRLIVPMPVPLIRVVAGVSELVHLPFPVATDQLRQLRLDNIGPLDLIPTPVRLRAAADGGRARLPADEAARTRSPARPRPRLAP